MIQQAEEIKEEIKGTQTYLKSLRPLYFSRADINRRRKARINRVAWASDRFLKTWYCPAFVLLGR